MVELTIYCSVHLPLCLLSIDLHIYRTYLPTYLPIYRRLSTYLHTCLSIYCRSIGLPICRFIDLSICLPIRPCIYRSNHRPIYLCIYLSIDPVYLSYSTIKNSDMNTVNRQRQTHRQIDRCRQPDRQRQTDGRMDRRPFTVAEGHRQIQTDTHHKAVPKP